MSDKNPYADLDRQMEEMLAFAPPGRALTREEAQAGGAMSLARILAHICAPPAADPASAPPASKDQIPSDLDTE